MPPEIVALIDKPLLLAAVLAVGAICGMAVERIGEKWNRTQRRAYWEKRNGGSATRSSVILAGMVGTRHQTSIVGSKLPPLRLCEALNWIVAGTKLSPL